MRLYGVTSGRGSSDRGSAEQPLSLHTRGEHVVESGPSDGEMVMVTFRLPRAIDAHRACVVSEFNDWSETANPMERDRDSFLARIPLAPGRPYRFRYLLDGERWENDWAADAYVTNDFGGDDSVIDLTDKATEVPAVPRRHQRRRRTQRTGHRREPKRKRTRVPR